MSLRELRRATTRARVTAASRALLAEQGFDATTIRAIAQRAGVSVGTAQNYVGSKVELVVELFADDLEATITARAAIEPASGSLQEKFLHYFVGFFELYASEPALSRTYVQEAVFAPDAAFARYAGVTLRFLERLSSIAAASGELRAGVDPALAAQLCFDTYIGVVVLLLRQDQPDVAMATAALDHRLGAVLALMRRS
jgi:AcrR family transcriptional regulator